MILRKGLSDGLSFRYFALPIIEKLILGSLRHPSNLFCAAVARYASAIRTGPKLFSDWVSTARHQVVDVPGLDELCGVFADGQRLEVSLAALDLGAFLVAQVVGEEAALGLDHEVEPLRAVLLDQHGPVRVVGAERRRDLEPAGELGVDLDRLVLLQLLGKGAFDAGRIVDHLLVDRLRRGQHVLEVAGQLLLLEEFLGVVVLVAEALVLDAVHQGEALGAVDGLGGQLDELLRVALEVVEPAAVGQDAHEAAAGELGLVLEVGQQVGQFDVGFVEHDRRGGGAFPSRRHAALPMARSALRHLHAGLGDGRASPMRLGALRRPASRCRTARGKWSCA